MDKVVFGIVAAIVLVIVVVGIVVLFQVQISQNAMMLGGFIVAISLISVLLYYVLGEKNSSATGQKYWEIYEKIYNFWLDKRKEKLDYKMYIGKYYGGSKTPLHGYVLEVSGGPRAGLKYVIVTTDSGQIASSVELPAIADDEFEAIKKNPFKFLTNYEGSPVPDFDLSKDLSTAKFVKEKPKEAKDKEDKDKEDKDNTSEKVLGFREDDTL